MKKAWTVVVATAVLLGAAGLFFVTYYPEKAQNILVPEIKDLRSAEIRVTNDSLHALLVLEMRNSGPFRMNIDSLVYEVHFDTIRALNKAQDLAVALKPGHSDTFAIPVNLPYKKIFGRIRELQHRDTADIKVDARVVYSTIFGKRTLRHKKTSRIAMPRPPDLDVEKVEYAGRSGSLFNLRVHLAFNNRSAMMLLLSDVEYKIVIGDIASAMGHLTDTIGILPYAVTRHVFPVEIRVSRPVKTLFLLAADQDLVEYSAEVKATLTSNDVLRKSRFAIRKNGKTELLK